MGPDRARADGLPAAFRASSFKAWTAPDSPTTFANCSRVSAESCPPRLSAEYKIADMIPYRRGRKELDEGFRLFLPLPNLLCQGSKLAEVAFDICRDVDASI